MRFYRNRLPEKDSLVYIKVAKLDDICATVQLLEYGNVEGMIMKTEASKFRQSNVRKILKEGKKMVATVLRVDEEKSLIDLSKKRVTKNEVAGIEERYANAQHFHLLITDLGIKFKLPIERIYEHFGWYFYDLFGTAMLGVKLLIENKKDFEDKFKTFVQNKKENFENLCLDDNITVTLDEMIEELEKIARRRMGSDLEIKVKAEFKTYSFEESGVLIIKKVITHLLDKYKNEKLSLKYLAAPNYSVIYSCNDKNTGIPFVEEVLSELKSSAEREGLGFLVSKEAHVSSN